MNTSEPLPEFADLESLPIRVVWPHEAQGFTRWLAANLDRLSAVIGVPLRLIEAKAVGGSQIADLLARDERDGSAVVIENQLEASDYSHLGQTLTYAAAVDARSVIWIAARFEAPHLAVLRWLNTKTPSVGFYAVEVRVVRIAASAPAVILAVLERPNRDGSSSPVATMIAPIAVGGFAAAFWALHLGQFPDEAKLSRPVGERCRWRRMRLTGVVIGQMVQEHAATVFLRGRYGVPLETVEEALAPFAEELEQRLGVRLRGDRRALLAEKTLALNVSDPSNWPLVSAWLRAQADGYDAALREIATSLSGNASRRRGTARPSRPARRGDGPALAALRPEAG